MSRINDNSIEKKKVSALDSIAKLLQTSTEYPVIGADLNGKISSWNDGAKILYGYEPNEVVGKKNNSILYTDEERKSGLPQNLRDIAIKKGKWVGNITRVRKNGEHFITNAVLTPRKDIDGKPIGFLLISHDKAEALGLIEQLKETQIELAENKSNFLLFTENTEEVFWRISPKLNKISYANHAYEEVYGYSVESLYANPKQLFESIVPEDQPLVKKAIDRLLKNKVKKVHIDFNIRRPTGEIRNIYSRIFQLRNEKGKLISLLGIDADATDYKKSIEITKASKDIQRTLKRANNNINYIKDINDITPLILDKICDALNFKMAVIWMKDPEEEVLRCFDARHQENVEAELLLKDTLKVSIKKGVGISGKAWKAKKTVWLPNISSDQKFPYAKLLSNAGVKSILASPIMYHNELYGVIELFSLQVQETDSVAINFLESACIQLGDFMHHRGTEKRLENMTNFDSVTGLINRISFLEKIKEAIKLSKPKLMGIIVLNLDNLNLINDTFGHEGGDYLLQTIANKLQKIGKPKNNIIARLDQDKFAFALVNISDLEDIKSQIKVIQSFFENPFIINDQEVFVNVSIGISSYPLDGNDPEILLNNADIALNSVKEQGDNNVQFFKSGSGAISSDRISLEADLQNALLKDEFCVYYQPKIDIKTGKICSLEALIRWNHPKEGILTPDTFILVAEQSGLIISIGKWVLKEVCRQIKNGELIVEGMSSIAINLSAQQIGNNNELIYYIEKLIKEYSIDPNFLELEVTESALINNIESSLVFLNSIKKLGIKIALDDFGTGYSSLTYLYRFPIDVIKIDKSFIDGIPHDNQNAAIVSAIIALSHNLGLKVVAEGVDKKEQLEFLIEHDCDQIQGYLYSKPLPANQIKKLYGQNKKWDLIK